MRKLFSLLICCLIVFSFSCKQEATVDEVVNMVAKASGGADTLDAITDQVSTWDFTMHMMPAGVMEGEKEMAAEQHEMPEGAGMSMPMIITAKKPNKLRMDFQEPDGKTSMSSCYDGTTGWSNEWGKQRELSESELQEWDSMAANWIDGFLHYQDKGFTLELLPNEEVEGQNYIVLQSTDKHNNVMKFYINPTTYYIEREVGEMLNFEGKKEPMYMTMKDYKMVDGIAMAHHVAQYNEEGKMIWEATMKDCKNNTGVEDAVFMPEAMTAK
ncbi:MAG: hypothetical protein ACE5HX_09460 [bacterium]